MSKVIDFDDVDRSVVLDYADRIPWETYVGAGFKGSDNIFVDAEDVRIIQRYSKESPKTMSSLLLKEPDATRYPQALLKAMLNITDLRVVQYVLTLTLDFLEFETQKRVKYFVKPGDAPDSPPFALPFLQLVGTSGSGAAVSSVDANPYVVEHAALCAAHMLSVDARDTISVSGISAWIMTNIAKYSSVSPRQVKITEVAAEALGILLGNATVRNLFVEEGIIPRLVAMLGATNTQILYSALFSLWLLSLQKRLVPELIKAGAVTAVTRLCRIGSPIKINRMGLAMVVNVAKAASSDDVVIAEISETQVPELVETLLHADPPTNDQEMLDDLNWISDALAKNKSVLSSIQRYERELATKRLEWNAVHTHEFWAENARAFEADGFRLIKELKELLLDKSASDQTVAVALHDLGEFAVNHPQGRSILQTFEIRPLVMGFLRREEDDVKQQALLATSKMMTANWESIASDKAKQ